MVKINEIEQKISLITNFENKIDEVNDYFNLAIEENDKVTMSECHESLNIIIAELEKSEFQMQFNGKLTLIVVTLKYMLELAELKVRIGHKCCRECICVGLNGNNLNLN